MAKKDFGGLNTTLIRQLRKKIEELNEEKEKLQIIFDSANDGILIADIESKKFYTGNKAICRMLGYSLDEIKNLNVLDIHPKKDLPYVLGQFKLQAIKKIDLAKNMPVKRKDGSIFYADINSSPIRISGKSYLLGIFRDITEKKKAEEKLRASEEKYKAILNNSPAVIFVKDINGNYLFVNALYEKLFHVTNKKISGKTDYNVFPKKAADAFRTADLKVLKANRPIEVEEVVPQKDSIHYYISLKFPLYNASHKPYAVCGIATDITERKKAEEKLTILKRAVDASEEVIFLTDIDGLITYVNLEFTRIYGYKSNEVVGKTTPRILKSGAMKRKDYQLFWKTILNKQLVKGEIINKTKKGKLITMIGSANPILNENKEIIGFLAIQRAKAK